MSGRVSEDSTEDFVLTTLGIVCAVIVTFMTLHVDDNYRPHGASIEFRAENGTITQDTIQDIYFYLPNADTLINKKDLLK